LTGQSTLLRIGVIASPPQPLEGVLVVDLTHYLPGAFASRELALLGARVVRVEPPDGSVMRRVVPAWDDRLRRGKESVVCDLPVESPFARALLARADVVLEGFRPGVATRLGIGPADVPAGVVYCSITGFGLSGRHASRAGHDLNYLGWAGVLEDTPAWPPPIPIADLAAGGLTAVTHVLAALVRRARTGTGDRIVVSMTHAAHELVSYRLGGEPLPRTLTGGLACYRAYATADGRHLTVAALEPPFFAALCRGLGRPDLEARQYDADQERLADDLAAIFATEPLASWLERFDNVDACVGPVATRVEAHRDLGPWPAQPDDVPLGAHTDAWKQALGLPPRVS
jgi:crotonobetainyl-CoA:carnitine CoA-transferase CaiB-like acyl-CoA transferase